MFDEFGESGFDESIDISEISEPPLEVPEVPEVTEIPEYPETSDITEVPEVTDVPEIPEFPDTSDVPEEIEEPEVSEEIEGTEVPVEPLEIEPTEEPDEPEETPEIDQAVDALGNMDNLNPGTWDSIGSDERLEALQDIEDQMAEIQGRPPVEVVLDDTLQANEFGGWNGEVIKINTAHLNSDMPVDEFIDTIVHEGRHADQDYAIEHPGFIADNDLVTSWAENQPPDNYLRPEDYGQEIYENQPTEADAWNYATQIRNTLIANNWS